MPSGFTIKQVATKLRAEVGLRYWLDWFVGRDMVTDLGATRMSGGLSGWCAAAVASVLFAVATLWASPPPAQAISGKQPIVVVLCKFTDQLAEPHNVAYYQDMVSETGAGRNGLYDYWRTVSYGKLDLTGSVAKGWYTADKKVSEFDALDRRSQIDVCASKAKPDVDFNKFSGVMVLTNHTGLQGPLFGGGVPTTIGGTTYTNLAMMASEEDVVLAGILHESLHLLRGDHSRTLLPVMTNQHDYGDGYDIGSCLGCFSGFASYQGPGGPGMNSVQLDIAGWLPAERVLAFNNSTSAQQTVQMVALNHPEASGPFQVRFPAAVPIKKTTLAGVDVVSTASDYYSVELRSKSGWDVGIPQDTFLVHLKGKDNHSYWVNNAGVQGALTVGQEFVDAGQKTYVAVNSIDATPAVRGVVTVASRKINVNLNYTGPTSAAYHDTLTLTASLKVDPSGAPIPTVPLTLSLGSQNCSATTDTAGNASCQLRLEQAPGAYDVKAAFAGTMAYNSQTAGTRFRIDKGKTTLRYEGPPNIANDSPATFAATLIEDNGSVLLEKRTVTFTLGSGTSAQNCTGTTNSNGRVECQIPSVAQPADTKTVGVQAAFAGDDFFLPASASGTAKLLYYTGNSIGLTTKQPVLQPTIVSDTGERSTASRSNVERSAASFSTPVVSASALRASVVTGDAKSIGEATAGKVVIGIPGLPVVEANLVRAFSQSVCRLDGYSASASGEVMMASLSIGGVAQSTALVAPNTIFPIGAATLTLNEQRPVPGSAGLLVNAIHLSWPGVADVVVSAAKSDLHNCP